MATERNWLVKLNIVRNWACRPSHFFVWDIAIKKGNIQIVGTASYAAPLLSTAFLVIAGIATPSWSLGAAAIMIAAGALLAASSSIQIKN